MPPTMREHFAASTCSLSMLVHIYANQTNAGSALKIKHAHKYFNTAIMVTIKLVNHVHLFNCQISTNWPHRTSPRCVWVSPTSRITPDKCLSVQMCPEGLLNISKLVLRASSCLSTSRNIKSSATTMSSYKSQAIVTTEWVFVRLCYCANSIKSINPINLCRSLKKYCARRA